MRFSSLVTALLLCAACGSPPAPVQVRRAPPPAPLSADAYAHYLRGRVAAYEGDVERATRELGSAARAAPDEAGIELSLIEALLRAGHGERAQRRAERARRRWPTDPDVWLVAGRVHHRARQPRAAARAYERAIELAPQRETGYLGLAAAQIAMGRMQHAQATYAALVEAVPDSVAGRVQLGEQLVRRDPEAAEPHLRRALELEPDHLGARLALSRAQRAQGKEREAVTTLREAFDRSKGDPRVGEELFTSLLEMGQRREAVELLDLLDRDDLELETRASFGYLYLRAAEPERAVALAAALRRQHPGHAGVLLLEARALRASGRGLEAVAPLLAVAPQHRAHDSARGLAIELLARAGQLERALALSEEALAQAPDRAPLIMARALALELSGDAGRARSLLEDAITSRDDDERDEVELRYALAALEERQGRPDHAVDLIEVLLRRDPDDATALNFIGYSLADRGVQLARARRLLSRALELEPDSGYLLDSWGWLLFREGRLDEAERVLRRAARLAPAEPEILWHLGELLLARGDRQRALSLIERAQRFAVDSRVRARLDARLHALRPRP